MLLQPSQAAHAFAQRGWRVGTDRPLNFAFNTNLTNAWGDVGRGTIRNACSTWQNTHAVGQTVTFAENVEIDHVRLILSDPASDQELPALSPGADVEIVTLSSIDNGPEWPSEYLGFVPEIGQTLVAIVQNQSIYGYPNEHTWSLVRYSSWVQEAGTSNGEFASVLDPSVTVSKDELVRVLRVARANIDAYREVEPGEIGKRLAGQT